MVKAEVFVWPGSGIYAEAMDQISHWEVGRVFKPDTRLLLLEKNSVFSLDEEHFVFSRILFFFYFPFLISHVLPVAEHP